VLGVTRDERGVALPMAMTIIAVIALLAVVLSDVAVGQVGQAATDRNRAQALATAQAGLDLAIDRLRTDADFSGGPATSLGPAWGTYTITVAAASAPDRRIVTSVGVYPASTARRRATRTVQAEVAISAASSSSAGLSPEAFSEVWFCGTGGCSSGDGLDLTGAVYSAGPLSFAGASPGAHVTGDVVAQGDVLVGAKAHLDGDLVSGAAVTVESKAKVFGDVVATSDVVNGGQIKDSTQTGGTATGGGKFGPVQQHVDPPPRPTARTRPTYTWDAAASGGATTWASSAAFEQWYDTRVSAGQPLTGTHRVDQPTPLTLSGSASVTSSLTVVATGPVLVDGARWTATSGGAAVAIVALGAAGDEIRCTGTVGTGSGVTALWWSEGDIDVSCSGSLQGVVSARSIRHDTGNLAVAYAAPTVPAGFGSDTGSSGALPTVQVLRFWQL
jgi:hypothetical protein